MTISLAAIYTLLKFEKNLIDLKKIIEVFGF